MKPLAQRGHRLSAERIGRVESSIREREKALQEELRRASECKPRAERHAGTLTECEVLVLKMTGLGMMNAEMADALGCSLATVQFHLRIVRDKLALPKIRRLVAVAAMMHE